MENPKTRYGIAAVLRVEQGNYFGNADDVWLPVPELHGCCMITQKCGAMPTSAGLRRVETAASVYQVAMTCIGR